jgi:uncharacterized protein with PIN domain
MTLDINVGRELTAHLCPDCRLKLEEVLTEKDIKNCVRSPFGYKKLVNKIETNTCADCQEIIWNRGRPV